MEGKPKLALRTWHLPKAGSTAEQYEDAWAAHPSLGRIAVADGATDSYASGRFARLLVEGFVDAAGPRSAEEFGPWVRSLASQWAEATPTEGLPWYKQEKARLGAHCTFLGVELDLGAGADPGPDSAPQAEALSLLAGASAEEDGGGRKGGTATYRAFTVGDACLFHVRDGRLIRSLPIEDPDQFGVQPALIATSRSYAGPGLETLAEHAGSLEPGDVLVLATDAIARWLLVATREDEQPWRALLEASDDDFARLIGGLRERNEIRNDDVTVVAAEVSAPEPIAEPSPPEAEAGPVPSPRSQRRRRRRGDRAVVVAVALGVLLLGVAAVRSRGSAARVAAAGCCF